MWHEEFSSGGKSKKSLVYSSKDGTLFALNALRITCCAPGLPRVSPSSTTKSSSSSSSSTNEKLGGAKNPDSSRTIPLPEPTEVLSILFEFILPKPPPTLEDLDPAKLVEVLTAARKYKVYSAVSIGEYQLRGWLGKSHLEWRCKLIFEYGLAHRLARFIDDSAPRVYRDVKREELLGICNRHGVLHAWTRYQLLWDHIIEEACQLAFRSSCHNEGLTMEMAYKAYKHYSDLRDLEWERDWSEEEKGVPEVAYNEFLDMLEKNTLLLTVNGVPQPNLPTFSVTHINKQIKEKIKGLPTFSSFLESNQKDGDAAFERDDLDSEEEDETQDVSG